MPPKSRRDLKVRLVSAAPYTNGSVLDGRIVIMAISRADRRAGRELRAKEAFGTDADAALDLLELTELAWHDCYGEVTPPDDVIDDVLVYADGTLSGLIRATRLAVEDYRDLRVRADALRR